MKDSDLDATTDAIVDRLVLRIPRALLVGLVYFAMLWLLSGALLKSAVAAGVALFLVAVSMAPNLVQAGGVVLIAVAIFRWFDLPPGALVTQAHTLCSATLR